MQLIPKKADVNLKVIIKYIITNMRGHKARATVMLLSISLSSMQLFVSFSIGLSYESAQRKMVHCIAGSAAVSAQSTENSVYAQDISDLSSIQTKAGILKGTSLYHENGYYEIIDLLAADMKALNRINKSRLQNVDKITGVSGY